MLVEPVSITIDSIFDNTFLTNEAGTLFDIKKIVYIPTSLCSDLLCRIVVPRAL